MKAKNLNQRPRKLHVSKETLRNLSIDALEDVRGGVINRGGIKRCTYEQSGCI